MSCQCSPTLSGACGQTLVGDHMHVQPLLAPHRIHHTDDLKNQHVLIEIIARLKKHIQVRAHTPNVSFLCMHELEINNGTMFQVISHLADDAGAPGQRILADERDLQRSSVGVVELTGLEAQQ